MKFIIPSILRECRPASWRTRYKQPQRRSFIVADLKGELTKKTSRAVRSTHDTKLLSFLEPHLSVRYNHIAKIRTPIQAWTFAEVWVANTGKGREEFWEELSRGMIGNAVLHLAHTKPGANLLDLYELLYPRTPEQIVEVFLSSPIKPVQDGAKGLMSSMAKNEKLVGAAYADMQRRIRSIGFVSQLAETTAFDELDLEAFGKKPTALYIKFDPRRKMLLAPYVACFFTQLIDALIDQAERRASSSLECPVMMYLDEFANIGVIPRMDDHVTTLRSYNIGFFIVVQDLAQLQDRYGETAAQTIFGSAGTKICLGGVNSEDAELFSKLSGQQTVLTLSQGDNREITRVPWATGGNRGTSETGKPLIYPDELRTMGEDVFVISGSRRPIRARPKPWFKDSELRWMVPDLGKCNPMDDFRRELQVHLLALPAPREEVAEGASSCGQLEQGGEQDVLEQTATIEVRSLVERLQNAAKHADAGSKSTGDDEDQQTHKNGAQASPKSLSPKQRDLLLAMEAHPQANQPELIAILGWKGNSVRSRLSEVRTKLRADAGDDLVGIARSWGLLPAPQSPAASAADGQILPTAFPHEEAEFPDYRDGSDDAEL